MFAAGATGPCGWCLELEKRIASQATRIQLQMDEMEKLQARNSELLADNRRLRLTLGHRRAALAAVRNERDGG